jgi:cyclopropane fatty-acyl-phospholipid synthase-like methyltransferase
MSAAQSQLYPAPFDAVAASYDDTFTLSAIGRAQRSAVWRELEKSFQPGDRVLEIGCGTGVDASFLARRGVQVLACDSSSQMIAVASLRIRDEGFSHLVQPLLLPAEAIASLRGGDAFDGAFSNFGALNCLEDLQQFAIDLAANLKPGATALLCWIGPFCFWETMWYLGRRSPRKAFRRLNRDGVSAKLADGAFIHVRYPTVRQIARAFAPQFRLKSIRGIGVAVPPSYVDKWAQRHPQLLRLFERTDSVLGRLPGARLAADHVLVRLQRTHSIGAAEAGAERQ